MICARPRPVSVGGRDAAAGRATPHHRVMAQRSAAAPGRSHNPMAGHAQCLTCCRVQAVSLLRDVVGLQGPARRVPHTAPLAGEPVTGQHCQPPPRQLPLAWSAHLAGPGLSSLVSGATAGLRGHRRAVRGRAGRDQPTHENPTKAYLCPCDLTVTAAAFDVKPTRSRPGEPGPELPTPGTPTPGTGVGRAGPCPWPAAGRGAPTAGSWPP